MQPAFTTQRLFLSPLTFTDDEFILALLNTPGWLQFIGDRNVHTIDDARAYITRIDQNPAFKYWVVMLKSEAAPAGIITLLKRDYLTFPDIGFAFLPGYSKSGYAFEATTAVLDYLSAGQIVERLLATTLPGNINSIRLLTRLGFKMERQMENAGEKLLVYGLSLPVADQTRP